MPPPVCNPVTQSEGMLGAEPGLGLSFTLSLIFVDIDAGAGRLCILLTVVTENLEPWVLGLI